MAIVLAAVGLSFGLAPAPAAAQTLPADAKATALAMAADPPAPSANLPSEPASQEAVAAAEEDADGPLTLLSPNAPVVQLRPEGQLSRYGELFEPGLDSGPAQDSTAPEPSLTAQSPDNPFDVPIIRNEKVETHIRFFNVAIRDRFEQWLHRLGRYWPHVESIFKEFDLPSDLVYLSLVESGFNPHAYSRARATGPWQFIKSTARLYGLRVDEYVDERRDPIKSTVAAARYLRDLYDLFGTWPLALAAYNAGEGKIQRALEKARAESFWEIAKTRYLRRETKDYVPRFMAATIIAKHPDQFGFSAVPPDPHEFEEVAVRRPLHLSEIAKVTGVPYAELRRLNPELRKDVTPPTDPVYLLKVPVAMKEQIAQALDRVPTWKPARTSPSKKSRSLVRHGNANGSWYRVQAGDSLWKIAKRFQMSVKDLVALNRLAGRKIKPGDLLAVQR
ncbi:transglycosylase SLT domain-containing protein [Nitrospira sp. Kam-Ns4a]